MNSENRFWTIIAIMLVSLAAIPTACTMHQQSLVAEAIKDGKDPIAVRCALASEGGQSNAVCAIKAMEGKK